MKTCPNCETVLTCSCQVRVASDQKVACASCIYSYEEMLKNQASA
jgi:RNase P subunit RPR2